MKHLSTMDNMKAFFTYTMCFECGVRKVGFKGCLADWELLKSYIQGLFQFDTKTSKDAYFEDPKRTYASWIQDLTNIVDKFIDTFKGNANKEWWNLMMAKKHVRYGSDSSTYLKGWMNALISKNAIDQDMNMNELKALRFSVPVKIDDNGVISKVLVMGGFSGSMYDKTNAVWSPHRSIVVLGE